MSTAPARPFTPLEQRFWNKVTLEQDGCWEWDGGCWRGYGRLFVKAMHERLAHRVSWRINVGPIPEGRDVLHKCDNQPCVRPDHLFLGTQTDNNADMFRKGRHHGMKGVKNHKAKITDADVRDIRAAYLTGARQVDLAAKHSITQASVSAMLLRKTWKHVE